MGAFSEKWDKVDFSDARNIPPDDFNDEDDYEVEDTSTEIDTEIAAALQEKIDRGEY
ncbi:hypothetical protein [Nocardia salmonicida]|uniref:hypothetical protein n=1 Tax=Nocardia salmonicida TaxID=53431 RepID=UPI0037A28809